jgi:predicted RecA/RadA family phage recombinase
MAKNRVYAEAHELSLPVPEGAKSGDPVVVGDLPGVLLIDRRPATDPRAGTATLQFDGAYKFPVEGKKKGGNQKIEPGQKVFLLAGKLSANNEEGKFFGYALEEVASAATTVIIVKVGF